jgi:uncharacterized membrane protein YhaH (DUF805 family)
MEWAIMPLKRYAEFSGRTRRKEYWLFLLLTIGLGIVAGIIDRALLGATAYGPVTAILYLGLLVPSIAVSIRRLHDTDRSGWWLLIALIPLVGAIILIVFYATDGTKGSNRFGADPKTGDPAAAF